MLSVFVIVINHFCLFLHLLYDIVATCCGFAITFHLLFCCCCHIIACNGDTWRFGGTQNLRTPRNGCTGTQQMIFVGTTPSSTIQTFSYIKGSLLGMVWKMFIHSVTSTSKWIVMVPFHVNTYNLEGARGYDGKFSSDCVVKIQDLMTYKVIIINALLIVFNSTSLTNVSRLQLIVC